MILTPLFTSVFLTYSESLLVPLISSPPSPVWSTHISRQFPPLPCFQIPPWSAGQQSVWQIWRWQITQAVFACCYVAEEQINMLHLHYSPSPKRATNEVLLLILIKCFKNLNLFENFILLSNSFGTGHHWGMTDRWYNHISLLSLGSHIKKQTNKHTYKTPQNKTKPKQAKIIMLLFGD